MSENIIDLLQTVVNPFSQVRVDNAWDAFTDAASIHADAYATCRRAIDEVRRGGRSQGLLISGRPGSGKTHLLARLRHEVTGARDAWFTYVLPVTTPERFFRHVLQAVVADVLRLPAEGEPTQAELVLARLLAPVMDGARAASSEDAATWWRRQRQRHGDAASLLAALRAAFGPLAEERELDGAVSDVLLQHVARVNRGDAYAFLLGRSVTEVQTQRLGVRATLDDEDMAQEALVTLLRLAGSECPVVLTFDQIEGLQRDRADTQALVAFAHGVSQLFTRCRNLLVVTCSQISFLDDLRKAVGEALYTGRLAERTHSLQPLDAEQALLLARRRLEASVDLQQVRAVARERPPGFGDSSDALWPLSTSAVRLLVMGGDRTPRHVFQGCRELFEGARAVAAPAPPVSPDERLRDLWDETLQRELGRPRDVIDEGVYVDGLLRVCDVLGTARAERSNVRDVDFFVVTPAGHCAVSVCHAEHMTSLAARLRRLDQAFEQGRVKRLVILRDGRLPPVSPTAKATQTYRERLRERGASWQSPPEEAYAALAAIRTLLAAAAAGDLAIDGRTLPPEELKDWLARHLPSAVLDLHDAVVGTIRATPGDDHNAGASARLAEIVRFERVLALEAAAQQAGVTLGAARAALEHGAPSVGRLHGPPEVLFLRPDALERR